MKKVRRVVATADTPAARGFPRWAWWVLFLATFTFAVPLASPWWSTALRGELGPTSDEEGEAVSSATPPAEPVEGSGSMLKVHLHMRAADGSITVVEREIPYVRGMVPQIRAVVSSLATATLEAQPLLPAGTRILDVAFTKGGTVYVDFSGEFEAGRGVGASAEEELVKGIVRTITGNFAAARRVIILVDGKAAKPGHLDLSRSLRPDDPIFAEDPPDPSASPTPEILAASSPAPPSSPAATAAPAPAVPSPTPK